MKKITSHRGIMIFTRFYLCTKIYSRIYLKYIPTITVILPQISSLIFISITGTYHTPIHKVKTFFFICVSHLGMTNDLEQLFLAEKLINMASPHPINLNDHNQKYLGIGKICIRVCWATQKLKLTKKQIQNETKNKNYNL